MRIILQRVTSAAVRVEGSVVAEIGPGYVALVGVAPDDDVDVARALAHKTARLRVFDGGGRGAERSVVDVDGSVLVTSQFTLLAGTRRGNRPSWAGPPHPTARGGSSRPMRTPSATRGYPSVPARSGPTWWSA
jgi:D-tyrosyl-tRNA(Tyr) deacylase